MNNHSLKLSPTFFHFNRNLVADAAPAIRNGFEAVFGKADVVIMCWFHMMKCVKEKLCTAAWRLSEDQRRDIMNDILTLHYSWSEEMFLHCVRLFLDKWMKVSPLFVDYFEKNWVEKNVNWYEAAGLGTPSTNNALESFNGEIKKRATLRKRLPLGQFMNVLVNQIAKWSKKTKFQDTPVIDQTLFLKTYRFLKQGRPMTERRQGTMSMIWCPLKGEALEAKDMMAQEDCVWNTWEEFCARKKFMFIIFDNSETWNQFSTCTCSEFQKKYMCKHILGLAVIRKLTAIPSHIKAIPIGSRVPRGRIPKAKKALMRQNK